MHDLQVKVPPPNEIHPLAVEFLSHAFPHWVRWAYIALLTAGGLAVVGAWALRVNEYSEGPAVVVTEGRIEVTTRAGGIVEQVAVVPGQQVSADQTLVRFHMPEEQADRDATERELGEVLVRSLSDPADLGSAGQVAALRIRQRLARDKVRERDVRASTAGVVTDVRIRPGQRLGPGDVVLTIAPQEHRYVMMALLPARDLHRLKGGERVDLELRGFPFATLSVAAHFRSQLPISIAEARRFLGPKVADALVVEEPSVIMEARLPGTYFVAGGRRYSYHDGMHGLARVALTRQRMMSLLMPMFKAVGSAHD